MNLMRLSRRNIFRNKRRSLLSGGAIAVATAAMVFLFAFVSGIKNDMARQIQDFSTGQVRIQHKDYDKFQNLNPLGLQVESVGTILRDFDRNGEISSSVARISFPGIYFLEDEQTPLMGWAMDFIREKDFSQLNTRVISGRLPENGSEVALGSVLAQELGIKIGDEFAVMIVTSRRSTNYISFRVSGLVTFPLGALNKKTFLLDLKTAQEKLLMPDKATQVLVKIKSQDPGLFAESLAGKLPGDPDIRSWEKVPSLWAYMGLVEYLYDFIGIFFYLLASTVIISTTMMVVFERVREIGTLGAMGMTEKEILKLFFLEALQISVAGALLGLFLGVAVVLPFSTYGLDLRGTMDQLDMGISGLIYPMLNLRSLFIVPLMAVVVSSLAALIPAKRSTRIAPVEALRSYS